MSDFDRPTSTLFHGPAKRRPGGSRLSDRLARTFGGFDRTREELPGWEPADGTEYPGAETESWDAPDALFPLTQEGYDPVAVEQRIEQLEQEISDLRAHRAPKGGEIAAEIERIGEQTSAILVTAHEQAQTIKHEAQEQADHCLADAAANAVRMTADAKRRVSELDVETDTIWQERSRLLDDARAVGTALLSLVDEAATRFPAEPEKATHAVVAVPADVAEPEPEPAADQQDETASGD